MPPHILTPSPNSRTINRHALAMSKKLFQSGQYYYRKSDIVKLLNALSAYEYGPNTTNLRWGDCIMTMTEFALNYNRLGIRGTVDQLSVKKAMIALMLCFDNNNNIKNKKLLTEVLPHKDEHCRNDWIQQCLDRRELFDLFEEPQFLCADDTKKTKISFVTRNHLAYNFSVNSFLSVLCNKGHHLLSKTQ